MAIDLSQSSPTTQTSIGRSIDDAVADMIHEFVDMDWIGGHVAADFNLSETETDQYLRLAIMAILKAGGLPHVWNGHSADTFDYGWDPTDRFGKTEDEIARNVIRAWRERGPRDRGMGWGNPVIFAMPGTRI